MLVLTRKKGQKLIIADNIEIIILETRGDNVKIGIKAPRSVSIFREELYEEIKKANEQSSKDILSEMPGKEINLPEMKKDFSSKYLNKLQSFSIKVNKPETDTEK